MSIETNDGIFQVSLEGEGNQGYMVIRRQGPKGQEPMTALSAEQIVEIVLKTETAPAPSTPTELERVLEEHGLEVLTKANGNLYQASISNNAEYKGSRESQLLRSALETGRSPREAHRKLVETLNGKVLVVDAYKSSRREIQLPDFK